MAVCLTSCRGDDIVYLEEEQPLEQPDTLAAITGFYLLNEGNMGMNQSTLDYYDMTTGDYRRNIYATANPTVPKELGDVGNALAIYGSRLYAVVNCSNKVEVMDVATTRRLGQLEIANCRHIAFDGPSAYVTSYAGPVEINPDYTQRGYVARIDTTTLTVTDRCTVGFQPDGLAIYDGKIYVANSGGYMVPNYENTLSVIDLATMQVTDTIQIAINLQYVVPDGHGALWVTSRGDYFGTPARLFRYDIASRTVTNTFDIAVGAYWVDGDDLYAVGSTFNYDTYDEVPTYTVINMPTATVTNQCFVSDDVRQAIVKPYGVAVDPDTRRIYVTDAGNYVYPGRLYCIDAQGNKIWDVRTGDIPAHFAFTRVKVK